MDRSGNLREKIMSRKIVFVVVAAVLALASLQTAPAEAGKGGNGGGGKPPKDPPPAPITNPAIVFAGTDGAKPVPNFQVFITTADGSETQQLTDEACDHTNPVWSPDGSRIAVLKRANCPAPFGLYAMDADGSNVELLLEHQSAPLLGLDLNSKPSWSPDNRIAFIGYGGGKQVFVLDLNDSPPSVEQITPTMLPPGFMDQVDYVTWSPDTDLATPGYQGKLAMLGGRSDAGGGGWVFSGIVILDMQTGDVSTLPQTAGQDNWDLGLVGRLDRLLRKNQRSVYVYVRTRTRELHGAQCRLGTCTCIQLASLRSGGAQA